MEFSIQSCCCYCYVCVCLECHLPSFAQGGLTSGMSSSSRKPSLTTLPGWVGASPLGTHNLGLPSIKTFISLWCNWFCLSWEHPGGRRWVSYILEFPSLAQTLVREDLTRY